MNRTLFGYTLLLGLVSTTCQASQVLTNIAPEPVVQKLVGTWEQQPSSTDRNLVIFTSNGEVFGFDSLLYRTIATKGSYTINSKLKPMHLDLKPAKPQIDSNEIVRSVFDLTPNGKLIWAYEPGKPRPTVLNSSNGLTFYKISDITTLQPDTREFNEAFRSSGYAQTKDGQAVEISMAYLRVLSKAQQAFYLETGVFAKTIEQLGGTTSETVDYRYQIEWQGDQSKQVKLTAQAKRPGLYSTTRGVFRVTSAFTRYDIVLSGACVTRQASVVAPAMPQLDSEQDQVICPPGSFKSER